MKIDSTSSGGYVWATALLALVIGAAGSACSSPGTPTATSTNVGAPSTAPRGRGPGTARPTVVLVHGAWADTSSWDGVARVLRAQGYDVRAVANPLENLVTDAASVANFLQSVHGPMVLVGHSYGGSVITNAAAGNPNVCALVYVDAAAPDVGKANGSLSGADSVLKQLPASELFDTLPDAGAPAGTNDLYLRRDVFVHVFASDLPSDSATQLWVSQRVTSTAAFDTPSRRAAWKTIPSWYFISSGDQIITPAAESAMADRAHSTVTRFSGGSHLTLISHPEAVAATIDSAIASVH